MVSPLLTLRIYWLVSLPAQVVQKRTAGTITKWVALTAVTGTYIQGVSGGALVVRIATMPVERPGGTNISTVR